MPTKRNAYSYVRMSTAEQQKGDSQGRQADRAEAYAKDHDLNLVVLPTDVLSAYRGDNREFGHLRGFLSAVKSHEVLENSVLIVESLDRLSRQNAATAFGLLSEIITSGIDVVTLIDGQNYTRESIQENGTLLLLAITAMLRAHDESRTKSIRLAAVWGRKRRAVTSRKLTALAPAWLRLKPDRSEFLPIAERTDVVRRIFQMARSGYGAFTIAKKLNEDRVPTWSPRSKMWGESYVKKIIASRAVLGEYQPHKMEHSSTNKRRVPSGNPIPDYFPAIISEDDFLSARVATKIRASNAAGRKGPTYANLFTGLLVCASCGGRMRYQDKGKKGGGDRRYLYCASAMLKAGCNASFWSYDRFEARFLKHLKEVDLDHVLGGERRSNQIRKLEVDLMRLDVEIERLTESISALINMAAVAGDVKELGEELERRNAERTSKQSLVEEIKERIDGLKEETFSFSDGQRNRLIDKVSNSSEPDYEQVRRLVSAELRRVIKSVTLASDKSNPDHDVDLDGNLIARTGMSAAERREQHYSFTVDYRSGERIHCSMVADTAFASVQREFASKRIERAKRASESQSS